MATKDEDKKARKAARKQAAERRRASEASRRATEPNEDERDESEGTEASEASSSEPARKAAAKKADKKADLEEANGDGPSDALALRSGELSTIDGEDEGAEPPATDEGEAVGGDESTEEGESAAQLGAERYVLAGFFGAGILAAYVLGRLIHGVWSTVSNKDWFVHLVPRLAAVPDEDKTTYATLVAAVASFLAVIRLYRKPEIRTWSDEVASELTKVKWPTRKEVTSSTMVVIAASTVATLYLMLLDRLWAFITNLVYGSGS